MNYVGKPLAYVLATAEAPDDHDNLLRIAFGNEASTATSWSSAGASTARWDGWVHRRRGDRHARGLPAGPDRPRIPGVAIWHDAETMTECPTAGVRRQRRASSTPTEQSANQSTRGCGHVPGLLQRRHDATGGTVAGRHVRPVTWPTGTPTGWIYLAGRTADWMRVDGENRHRADRAHPLAAPGNQPGERYAVPDENVGIR